MKNHIKINGKISLLCQIIRLVCSLLAELELGAFHLNIKEAIKIRRNLEDTGRLQLQIEIITNNATVAGIVNKSMK